MIRRNGWAGAISLAGSRCHNRCGDGLNVTIGGVLHCGLDVDAIEALSRITP